MSFVRRARQGVGLALAGLTLALTGGCGNPVHLITGGNSIDDYCAALNADQKTFAAMFADGSATALLNHLPMLQDLAGQAPDDIADDWQTFVTALQGLHDALTKAGLKPSAYVGGKPPSGLSTRDRERITVAADQLSAQNTVQAAGSIDQEARDVCKTNLGL